MLDKEIQEHDSTVIYDHVRRLRDYDRRFEENHMLLNYNHKVSSRYSDPFGNCYYVTCLVPIETWEYYYSEINTTSTEEIAAASSLYTISPNPSQNIIHVLSTENDPAAVVLHLTDMQGHRVLSQETRPGASVDIANLASGVYIYQIMQDDLVVTGKVVVE